MSLPSMQQRAAHFFENRITYNTTSSKHPRTSQKSFNYLLQAVNQTKPEGQSTKELSPI